MTGLHILFHYVYTVWCRPGPITCVFSIIPSPPVFQVRSFNSAKLPKNRPTMVGIEITNDIEIYSEWEYVFFYTQQIRPFDICLFLDLASLRYIKCSRNNLTKNFYSQPYYRVIDVVVEKVSQKETFLYRQNCFAVGLYCSLRVLICHFITNEAKI
jgi:hypothetical protein